MASCTRYKGKSILPQRPVCVRRIGRRGDAGNSKKIGITASCTGYKSKSVSCVASCIQRWPYARRYRLNVADKLHTLRKHTAFAPFASCQSRLPRDRPSRETCFSAPHSALRVFHSVFRIHDAFRVPSFPHARSLLLAQAREGHKELRCLPPRAKRGRQAAHATKAKASSRRGLSASEG